MTEVLPDSNYLSPPDAVYKRSSSEPDIFAAGLRGRTCSNASNLQYNRARVLSRAASSNKERSRTPSPTYSSSESEGEVVDGR